MGLVLEATSFYAEAGGQTADTGSIATASGASLVITVLLASFWPKSVLTGIPLLGLARAAQPWRSQVAASQAW